MQKKVKTTIKVTISLLFAICAIAILCVVANQHYGEEYRSLGRGYIYSCQRNDILNFSRPSQDIPPRVEDIGYSGSFIIVKQSPKGRNVPDIYQVENTVFFDGLDSTYYWVIDKKTDTVTGPMSKEDFDALCRTNNITTRWRSEKRFGWKCE